MGLYYNPNPPHIGSAQPLEQRKLTPPQSGPAAQNPPLIGSRINQAILSCWTVAAVAFVLPQLLVPQPAAAAAFVPANKFPLEIWRAWDLASPAPIVAINLDPPIAAPVAQNPPFMGGAAVRAEILVGWLPPQPLPIVGPKFTLGVSVAANPPFMGGAAVRPEILLAWQLTAPAAITGAKVAHLAPTSSNPPFAGGARVSSEVLLNWLPPTPAAIAPARRAPPVSGAASSNPPFMGGAKIPPAVLIAWLPPLPAPIVAVRFDPAILTPAVFAFSPRVATVSSELRQVETSAEFRRVAPASEDRSQST